MSTLQNIHKQQEQTYLSIKRDAYHDGSVLQILTCKLKTNPVDYISAK